jgi:nicotinamide mononucleotide transporter
VYANARLYGLAGLQVVYAAVSVYGWYEWRHGGGGHGRLPVSRVPARWAAGLVVAGSAATVALGLFLERRTDAALPFRDAAITAFSLVAQWMATRKWLENWVLWMVLNVANTAVCASQGLYPMASFYGVLLVLAVAGFREWRRSLAAGVPAPAAAGGAA